MSVENKNVEMKIPNDLNHLPMIINLTDEVLKDAPFSAKTKNQVKVAIDEACTNVMKYAFAPGVNAEFIIKFSLTEEGLMFVLTDQGRRYNPLIHIDPVIKEHKKNHEQHGLGIYMMKKIMDKLEYHYIPGIGNRLTMIKCLPEKTVKECSSTVIK